MIFLWLLRQPPGRKSCKESKPGGFVPHLTYMPSNADWKPWGCDEYRQMGIGSFGDVMNIAKWGLEALGRVCCAAE